MKLSAVCSCSKQTKLLSHEMDTHISHWTKSSHVFLTKEAGRQGWSIAKVNFYSELEFCRWLDVFTVSLSTPPKSHYTVREQRWIPNGNFWVPSVILRKFLWFHDVAFAFDGWVMYKVLECTRLAIVLPFRSSVLPWRHRCCYRRGFKVLSNYERNA